ncbi:MAG TPA: hypothetical protein VMJ70_01835 [Candidatus Sulfotelmatobacter sp.]|nr:hypothetical protein [Candidatus Sulfotelmatobacter sp.]
MPRSISSWAALAVTALLALASSPRGSAAAVSKNLLINPGFEDRLPGHPWMPAAWDTSISGLPTVFFGCDTFLVHSGHYSANVANVSNLLPMAHNWSQSVLVGKEAWGKDLLFTVWTRSNGVSGRAYCLLQAYRDTISKMAKTWGMPRDDAAQRLHINKVDDPIVDFGWKRLYFDDPETDWVKREMRVYCAPGVNIVFVRAGVTGTGQLLVDDASLTIEAPLPAPPLKVGENLLSDPGFEGDLNAWEFAVPPYAGLVVERDTTHAHSGKSCIHLETLQGPDYPRAPVQARMGVCQPITNRNLGGKRVRLSAWVKTDSLQGVAFLKVYSHGLYGVQQGIASEQFSLDTPWTQTSQILDVPADTYQLWAWCLYEVPVPGRVYYDDVKLEVLGPTPPPPTIPKPAAAEKAKKK